MPLVLGRARPSIAFIRAAGSDASTSATWSRTASSALMFTLLRTACSAQSALRLWMFARLRTLVTASLRTLAPGLAGLVARWRRPLEDRLRNRLRLSAYRMGREDLLLYLRKIQAFRPASIYGYSTALYLLAREAAAA